MRRTVVKMTMIGCSKLSLVLKSRNLEIMEVKGGNSSIKTIIVIMIWTEALAVVMMKTQIARPLICQQI
jgi:hypothetical protein